MNTRLGTAVLILASLASGCVRHQLTLVEPDDADQSNQWQLGPGPGQQTGHLPQERSTTLVKRDSTGNLWRADLHLRTACAWSQRFPADLLTSLILPLNRRIAETGTVSWQPIVGLTPGELDQQAQAHGYADNLPVAASDKP